MSENWGLGGVGVLVKEELCEKVVEVRMRSERVMTVVMVLEEEVLRIIYVYWPQSGRMAAESKCDPPQPSGWLVPMFCCCHHEDFIGARNFYGEHALAYSQPQFSDMSGP